MATNIINLTQVSSQSINTYRVNIEETNINEDIFYHLGTNLTSNGTYTTPFGGNVIISLTEGSITGGALTNLIDKTTSPTFRPSIPSTILFEFANGFKIDLNSYVVYNSSTQVGGISSWVIRGSNDNTTWETLHTVTEETWPSSASYKIYYCPNNKGYFKYIDFRVTAQDTFSNFNELAFFGAIQNLTTGVAGYTIPGDLLGSLTDVDIRDINTNRVIKYNSTNQVWEAVARTPWNVVTQTMTGNITLTSTYISTFYILSPNGANREVTLPTSPTKDDAVKFKNLDGAFTISIKDSPSDVSPVVLNSAGKLQYEFVYDGTEWIVVG